MNIRRMLSTGATSAALFGLSMTWPAPVAAHCDSMDGPVVTAAYVHAYVEYIHFVEGIVEAAHAEGHSGELDS